MLRTIVSFSISQHEIHPSKETGPISTTRSTHPRKPSPAHPWVFCLPQAVSNVQWEGVKNFEVIFVGGDSVIDATLSTKWLAQRTKDWKFPTKVMANIPRAEAMEVITGEGLLLVLCSNLENMPYVLAEAAVKVGAWGGVGGGYWV